MNKNLNCIIHYENQSSYSIIKKLSETNINHIFEAKEKRSRIGGGNSHADQIKQIPNEIDLGLYGFQLEPCFKRFFYVLFLTRLSLLCKA